jgi:hypothetical protein
MTDDDPIARSLEELDDHALPEALGKRTLARATAWLGPRGDLTGWDRAAVPALLVSAAAVFLADVCAVILRVFGG